MYQVSTRTSNCWVGGTGAVGMVLVLSKGVEVILGRWGGTKGVHLIAAT